ncbi:hypothetical protein LKO27_04485 [Tessaracoccus sp. OS52]|uniref:hypothetical protein n=1 Tax=Tessaracoccus sp. OS52 TaxID=2886691 RepID=UPI001D0F68E5|nr:hypothetical protein [Tessaracoccus sp. OS52]MCC2592674.1 hypothetical protein [Tessaracoccus sp. OS52]
MVGKLIKHEAIRTRGLVLQILGVATLLAAAGALFAATQWPMIAQLGLVMGLLATIGLVPAIQLALGIDYWTSSYRRTGYFTQTLPIRGSTIYWAKLAWAVVVVIGSVVWGLLLGLVTFFGNAASLGLRPFDVFDIVGDFLTEAAALMPGWAWFVVPLLVLLVLTMTLVQYFFCASVGSEKRFNSMGIGGPIVVWVLLYVAMQLALMAFMIVIPLGFGMDGDTLGLVGLNFLDVMVTGDDPAAMPIGFIPGFLIAAVILVWRTTVSWNR